MNIIGQQSVIDQLRKSNAKSVLLVGPPHWGKKTILRELFSKEESVYEISGNAAVFREAIERIYTTTRDTVYLVPDLDKCNATIQNILLKVLEEPPAPARFFLTASNNVLPTITSRCVTYHMEKYSPFELDSFISGTAEDDHLRGKYQSPGQLRLLQFDQCNDLIFSLVEINTDFETRTLACNLKFIKNFNYKFNESQASQEVFIMLVTSVFGQSDSLQWLRSQPFDAIRHVRTQYFMRLWLERQVTQS